MLGELLSIVLRSKGTRSHPQSLALLNDAQCACLKGPLLNTEASLLNLTECFNPLDTEASYSKGDSWLTHFGQLVTLCARATRAILNHAPIGEYRQCFFPAECTQCLCGHCQVETRQHIFANCARFAHSPLIDPSPSIKNFVDFLKEHPSAFAFSSQDRPPTPPKPP